MESTTLEDHGISTDFRSVGSMMRSKPGQLHLVHEAVLTCLFSSFGFYALHNTLQTNATQLAYAARGIAVSLFACCLFLGQSLGMLVAAWLVDNLSVSFIFAFSVLGLLLPDGFFVMLTARCHTLKEA